MSFSLFTCLLIVTLFSTTHALTIRDLSRTLSHDHMTADTQHENTMSVNPFATPYYMHIKGTTHANVQGGVTEKGKEGSIAVHEIDHLVNTPYSATQGGGVATGRRQHQPLKVRIDIDKATPILYTMWSSNENMEIQIDQWNVGGTLGKLAKASKIAFHIRLMGANIISVHNVGAQLEVSFAYNKIEWTWIEGGIMGQDDWSTQHA